MPTPEQLKKTLDNRSRLLKLKSRTGTGEKVNLCPFGCPDEKIDENGYCRHLVGFTNDGKTYEPMVMNAHHRRVVQVKSKDDEEGRMILLPEAILPGDVLEPISTSSRVYRDIDKPAAKVDTKKSA